MALAQLTPTFPPRAERAGARLIAMLAGDNDAVKPGGVARIAAESGRSVASRPQMTTEWRARHGK